MFGPSDEAPTLPAAAEPATRGEAPTLRSTGGGRQKAEALPAETKRQRRGQRLRGTLPEAG